MENCSENSFDFSLICYFLTLTKMAPVADVISIFLKRENKNLLSFNFFVGVHDLLTCCNSGASHIKEYFLVSRLNPG